MAFNDQNDFASRIRSYLPKGWFPENGLSLNPATPGAAGPESAPVLNAVLQGFGWALNAVWQIISYAFLQTRIKTSTGGFLDLVALDFFGANIMRATGQTDASFLNTILINIFQPRVTVAALIRIFVNLTGRTPIVFEPAYAYDAFCLGIPQNGGLGYSRLGSYAMPGEILITAYRPLVTGISYVAGLGSNWAGLGCSFMAMPDPSLSSGFVSDAQIYAAADSIRAAGVKFWVNIQS